MMGFILGFILGIIFLLALVVIRMLRSDGWDDSNITNALRVISHVAVHPQDLGRMYYLTDAEFDYLEAGGFYAYQHTPFWYINLDEFSGVVGTRPYRSVPSEEQETLL